MSTLDFEKPVLELERKIRDLQDLPEDTAANIADDLARLEAKAEKQLRQLYSKLTPVQKVSVARHPDRPHTSHYIKALFRDFIPLCGDRLYGEDKALLGGLARFRQWTCVVMGHEKGHDMDTRLIHNFGMPRPEGYRKAQRLMRLAEQHGLPVITFVDTAGAYPGVGAEERGQAEAIAKSIQVGLHVTVPIITVVIGEGGSGGAIAIATADRVLMLEHAIYSVISPEGCASILWRNASHAPDAANALKLTAQDLRALNVIDAIIAEPHGAAHRKPDETFTNVADALAENLTILTALPREDLVPNRRTKFLTMTRTLP